MSTKKVLRSRVSRPLLLYFPMAVILGLIPLVPMHAYVYHVIILIFLWGFLATAWNIIGGFAGQVSLGHAAFFGIGAYTTCLLLLWFNLTPLIGIFVGAALAAVVGVGLGLLCFRFGIRGIYFALVTIAFAEILKELAIYLRDITGGSLGIWLPPKSDPIYFQFVEKWPYYYLTLALWFVSILVLYKMRKMKFFIVAIRENEDVAAAVGINITKYKILAMLLSAFLTGLGGGLYMIYYKFIDPATAFGFTTSLEIALMALVGGVFYVFGPTIGAAILVPIGEYLRITLGGTYAGAHLVIYGIIMILTILFMPKGIYGMLREKFLKELRIS